MKLLVAHCKRHDEDFVKPPPLYGVRDRVPVCMSCVAETKAKLERLRVKWRSGHKNRFIDLNNRKAVDRGR